MGKAAGSSADVSTAAGGSANASTVVAEGSANVGTANNPNASTAGAKMGHTVKGVLKITCRKCESELNLEARDLEREPKQWGTDPMTFSYQCSNCKRVGYIGYNKVPEDVLFDFYNKN